MKKILVVAGAVLVLALYAVTMAETSPTVQVRKIPMAEQCSLGYVQLMGGCAGIGGGGSGLHGALRV
jgi:hypothetical protein